MSMSFLVLPSIAEDFDITLRAVGWVVIIDALIVSAFLLPMGALADALGRKRVLLTGMAIFAIGAVLVGLAPTFPLLIAARVVMAVGNALVQSVTTGLLISVFPPEERGLAMGAQTTAVALGSATGPLIAGVALDVLPWETLFMLLAIPAGLSAVLIWVLIAPDLEQPVQPRFDRVGALLGALMITVVVVTINNPLDLDWLSPGIFVGVVIAIAALVAFVRWELRQSDPMLDLRLFAIPVFRWAVIVRVVGFIAATTTNFLFPIYLLSVRQLSSGRAGLLISCVALGIGVSAQISGRLYDRVGSRTPSYFGLVLQVMVNITFALSSETTSLWALGLVAVANGAAMGLWNVPNNSAMMGATPPESLGVGGAFSNVTRTVGSVLGQATAAAVVVAVMASKGFDIPLGDIEEIPGAAGAFLDGWQAAFFVAAGLSGATLLAATRLPGASTSPRNRRARSTQ